MIIFMEPGFNRRQKIDKKVTESSEELSKHFTIYKVINTYSYNTSKKKSQWNESQPLIDNSVSVKPPDHENLFYFVSLVEWF